MKLRTYPNSSSRPNAVDSDVALKLAGHSVRAKRHVHLCDCVGDVVFEPFPAQIKRLERELGAGLGNLSTRNRLRDSFSGLKFTDRLLDRDFKGQITDRKAKQNYKTGDRTLNRTYDSLFKQNRVPCPA